MFLLDQLSAVRLDVFSRPFKNGPWVKTISSMDLVRYTQCLDSMHIVDGLARVEGG